MKFLLYSFNFLNVAKYSHPFVYRVIYTPRELYIRPRVENEKKKGSRAYTKRYFIVPRANENKRKEYKKNYNKISFLTSVFYFLAFFIFQHPE